MTMLQIVKDLNVKQTQQEVHQKDLEIKEMQMDHQYQLQVTIPFKYFSNFGKSLDLLFVNCEMKLDLSWAKDRVLIEEINSRCKFCDYQH